MTPDKHYRRLFVSLLVVLVALAIGAAAYAGSRSDNPDGNIDQWHVKDGSTEPSPVAYTVSRRSHRGKVTRIRVHDRSTDPRRHGRTRSGATEWCRTARGVGIGGNAVISNLVSGGVSQHFCYTPSNGRITSVGKVNIWQSVSEMGSLFLWHNDGTPYTIDGSGQACESGTGTCWHYKYHRGVFQWERGISPISQQINECVSITLRGTGRVIVGQPSC